MEVWIVDWDSKPIVFHGIFLSYTYAAGGVAPCKVQSRYLNNPLASNEAADRNFVL
jgi:hypothetical protein